MFGHVQRRKGQMEKIFLKMDHPKKNGLRQEIWMRWKKTKRIARDDRYRMQATCGKKRLIVMIPKKGKPKK